MTTHADILPRYRKIREVSFHLNNKLVKTLSKETLEEGGRRLGILKRGVLVFDSEDETSVLMDYCIYNVHNHGRNAVQRYLAETPPRAGSDEMLVLKAMMDAYYSILQVQSVERGVGVNVLDMLRRDTGFVADIGFGNTAKVGMGLAGRVIPFEGFLMSGGASLPVDDKAGLRVSGGLKRLFDRPTDYKRLTPDQEADLAAMVIRSCIDTGTASQIVYQTPGAVPSRGEKTSGGSESMRANRNDPCPCGSGRKYKSCHGKR
jgi:hypothetical protein